MHYNSWLDYTYCWTIRTMIKTPDISKSQQPSRGDRLPPSRLASAKRPRVRAGDGLDDARSANLRSTAGHLFGSHRLGEQSPANLAFRPFRSILLATAAQVSSPSARYSVPERASHVTETIRPPVKSVVCQSLRNNARRAQNPTMRH